MKKIILIRVVFIGLFLQGCTTTLKVGELDKKTHQFPSIVRVNKKDILTNKRVSLAKYKPLLVIGLRGDMLSSEGKIPSFKFMRDESVKRKENYDFWVNSLLKMGYFENVIPVVQLSSFLAKHKGYNNILIADVTILFLGNYDFKLVLKIKDYKTKETYFVVRKNAVNFSGLDSVLYYPVLNALQEWVKTNAK